MLIIEETDPRDPQATALLQASHQLMQELFPAESNNYLSIEELCVPEVTLFTARCGDRRIATGALANKDGYGEVKSMYTAPEARGSGAAGAILRAIEDRARDIGLAWLRLETGDSLSAAHRLYERNGFTFRGPFGAYRDDPLSLFMEKPLKD